MSQEFDPLDRIRSGLRMMTELMLDEECDFEVQDETGDVVATQYDLDSEEGAVLARYLVRLSGVEVTKLPATNSKEN